MIRPALALILILPLALVSSPFSEARAGKKEDTALLKQGNKLLEDWQLEDALKISAQLLLKYPDEPGILLLASRVQHARGNYRAALSLLHSAVAAGEGDGYYEETVESTGGYAEFAETLETTHFKIRYLNKDKIVAHYAREVLEGAYKNIGSALGMLPAERGEKIIVEIFPDARGLAGATGLSIAEIETSGTIAVCKYHRLMIISPLATSSGYHWADTIAHEFTHLVISKKSHNQIPIWLHEGIAKYYESLWDGAPGRALEPYAEKFLAEAVKNNELVTFDQMHPSMAKLPSQENAALAFAEVFTVIEFLRNQYGPGSIPKVLTLTGTGLPLEKALKKVFGLDLKGVESAWIRYIKKRKFKIFPGAKPERITLSSGDSEKKSESPLEMIEDPEAQNFSRLGELLQLRDHHKAAIIEYEKAHKKAQFRYPTLTNRLARAYIEEEQSKKAGALLKKMLVIHPGNSHAHLMLGRITFVERDYKQSLKHFRAARMKNPFNPEIHLSLAALYQEEGNSSLAELENDFLQLSRKKRSRRNFPPLALSPGLVGFVPKAWGKVLVDGEEEIQAPRFNYPLSPGNHRVEYVLPNGKYQIKEFKVGTDPVIVLLN